MEAVGAVGIQPLADKAVGLQIGLYQLLHEHTDGTALVLADSDPLVPVLVRADTVEISELQYVAPHLVERDLQAGVFLVIRGHIGCVQLIAQRAVGGDIEAGLERGGAEGLVVRTGGNMCADTALRIAVAVALLNMGAAEGVGVVAAPDLREVAEDTEVEAASARGAALKKDMRKTFGQRFHRPVKPQHVAVSGLALTIGGQIGRVNIGENAVHVPLDVGDITGGEDLRHLLDHPVGHLGIAQVEDALVSALAVELSGDRHRPVGVRFIQAGVDVDHLRLDPDTEADTEVGDLFRQTAQPSGELFGIRVPVAEGAQIVVAVSEPSVVHDEQLDAEVTACLCERNEIALADIEIGRFP